MALVRAYRIQCDRCHTALGFVVTAQEARSNARRARWKRIPKNGPLGERGRDWCPRCAAESTKDGTDG